ncbi:MAG: hypothetical protein EBZ77_06535, partial [Chitinophagia bacterium]|nr:hypothetical protein [Chitinophagia bacterium]
MQSLSNTLPALLAQHFENVHFGGNWTDSCLKQQLTGVTWQQAIARHKEMHSIAELTYHIHYFTTALVTVLQGRPLEA